MIQADPTPSPVRDSTRLWIAALLLGTHSILYLSLIVGCSAGGKSTPYAGDWELVRKAIAENEKKGGDEPPPHPSKR